MDSYQRCGFKLCFFSSFSVSSPFLRLTVISNLPVRLISTFPSLSVLLARREIIYGYDLEWKGGCEVVVVAAFGTPEWDG